ncbi:MAG TPA: DUF3313 domain-containing protein [Geobacteraceae bacterium]
MDIKGSMLVNPALLEKGSGDQALYRYVNPRFDVAKYSKIIIQPVFIAKEGELGPSERENYQKLANNAYVYLRMELAKELQIVNKPESDTLDLQMAIHDADSSKPVRNILSSVTPVGIGLNVVTFGVTGKQSGVGEITAEFRLTDAATGELLFAALDRRVGGKDIKGTWDTWHNADEALKYWAKRASFVLCQQKGKQDCEEP